MPRRLILLLTLACVALLATPAHAAQMMAVLELTGALPDDQRRALTDAVRQMAATSTRSAGIKVMTQENMEVLLSEMGVDASCLSEGACEVETFQNLQARYGVTGKVTDFGGTYVVTLQLYDVKAASLMGAENAKSGDALELFDPLVPDATRRLMGLLPGVSAPSVAVVTPPVAVVTPPVAVVTPPVAVVTPPVAVVTPPVAVVTPPVTPPPAPVAVPGSSVGDGFVGLELTGSEQSATLGKLVCIGSGSFDMGSPASEAGRGSNAQQHRVELTQGFCVMETEVTQGMYASVMGSNPSGFYLTQSEWEALPRKEKKVKSAGYQDGCTEACPVEEVSWLDAVTYANRVSAQEGLSAAYAISGDTVRLVEGATGYRLLTEAEWEAAARGRELHVYSGSGTPDSVAWTSSNSGGHTHPVKGQSPNGYGLYDMSGNVWEWTWDWYAESYGSGVQTDPLGPVSGSSRVNRGGSWSYAPAFARVAFRFRFSPSYRDFDLGFRLARTAP